MNRTLFITLILLTLTACAAQVEENVFVEPVNEEPIISDPARTSELCPDSGDGIGGTGCPDSEF